MITIHERFTVYAENNKIEYSSYEKALIDCILKQIDGKCYYESDIRSFPLYKIEKQGDNYFLHIYRSILCSYVCDFCKSNNWNYDVITGD